jgi:hypothetical protein
MMSRKAVVLALGLALAACSGRVHPSAYVPGDPDAATDAGPGKHHDASTGDMDATMSASDGGHDASDTGPHEPDADAGMCLSVRSADLVKELMAAPFLDKTASTKMLIAGPDDARFKAAGSAAIAWSRGDACAFRAAAHTMGYRAEIIEDSVTSKRHWVLFDDSSSFDGVFAFRAPEELAITRPLVIDSPHLGFDFEDDRAALAYRELDAVAFLQNTAYRCNDPTCSGCDAVQDYACGATCTASSDVVHSVKQLYFAVYDGLESARNDFHFEYHGSAKDVLATGCKSTAHLSQGSTRTLTASDDDGTFPNHFWKTLSGKLGESCVCYHQRETGCLLSGSAATTARRTNSEAAHQTLDACTRAPSTLAGRFVHFEAYGVHVADVIAALSTSLPLE